MSNVTESDVLPQRKKKKREQASHVRTDANSNMKSQTNKRMVCAWGKKKDPRDMSRILRDMSRLLHESSSESCHTEPLPTQ